MREDASAYFDLDRIVDPYGAPEFFVTRVGYIEMLPGPCIRLWCVFDQPGGAAELRFKSIMPIESAISSRPKVNLWLAQQGFALARSRSIIVPAERKLIM